MSFEIKQTFQRRVSPLWKYYSFVTCTQEISVSLQSGVTAELQAPALPTPAVSFGKQSSAGWTFWFSPKGRRTKLWKAGRTHILPQKFWRDKIGSTCNCLVYYRSNWTLLNKCVWPIMSISCLVVLPSTNHIVLENSKVSVHCNGLPCCLMEQLSV